MLNINKIKLGYVFSVMAFTLTILMSQTTGFYEMNGILRYIFNNYNTYQVILLYGFVWAAIFALWEWAIVESVNASLIILQTLYYLLGSLIFCTM